MKLSSYWILVPMDILLHHHSISDSSTLLFVVHHQIFLMVMFPPHSFILPDSFNSQTIFCELNWMRSCLWRMKWKGIKRKECQIECVREWMSETELVAGFASGHSLSISNIPILARRKNNSGGSGCWLLMNSLSLSTKARNNNLLHVVHVIRAKTESKIEWKLA